MGKSSNPGSNLLDGVIFSLSLPVNPPPPSGAPPPSNPPHPLTPKWVWYGCKYQSEPPPPLSKFLNPGLFGIIPPSKLTLNIIKVVSFSPAVRTMLSVSSTSLQTFLTEELSTGVLLRVLCHLQADRADQITGWFRDILDTFSRSHYSL